MTLSINMRDPEVRRTLGIDREVVAGAAQREVVQIAGDAPDPSGLSAMRGTQSTTRLTAAKQEVVVVYRDQFLTVDVYAVPGQPVRLHLYCPRCHKHSTIDGTRKHIEFDGAASNPQRRAILAAGVLPPELRYHADHGKLSVEAFECAWEIGGDQHVAGGVHTGATLCRLKLAIEDNRAVDA